MQSRFVVCGLKVVTLLLIPAAVWAQSVQYEVNPVTSPYNQPGDDIGHNINRNGVIAFTDLKNGERAFEWKDGKSTPLALLGGACSRADGINDRGQIVGGSCPAGDTAMHAYFYSRGVTLDLGSLGGVVAWGTGVNRYDQIAGNYTLADGTSRAFFWQENNWEDLGSLGGSYIFSYGINSSGTVVGQSDISNTPDPIYNIPPSHGFVWSAGSLTDLGSIFGSNFNYVFAINDAGTAAGSADLAGDIAAHTIVWKDGIVQDLSPDGNVSAGGTAINNLGQVVGIWGLVDPDPADGPPAYVTLCPCYAVLWQNGQEIFLNALVPPEWNLLIALAINDKGEIVAEGQLNGGPSIQTVVLKPIPSEKHFAVITATRPIYTGPRALRRDEKGGVVKLW